MLNMDFGERVVIDTRAQDWIASPMPGVWRKPLAREEAERTVHDLAVRGALVPDEVRVAHDALEVGQVGEAAGLRRRVEEVAGCDVHEIGRIVAAAEVAVGLALIVAIFRTKQSIDVDQLSSLKG